MTVKFGIIGVGNMGSTHCALLKNIAGAELAAVCDINPAAFDRIAPEQREKIRLYTDSEQFFRESGVDVAVVAVPHWSHPDLAIRALESGMNVIVEKPIAVHKAEAERLLREAAKYPKLVKSAMFNQRTLPQHRKLKSLIDAGEFGRITRVNWIITDWFRTQAYYDSGDWRASWRGEGGGVLLNQCPHQLDLMQWLFGMPEKVYARVRFGKYHDIEVEDEVNAFLEYPSGAVGNFIASTGEAPGTNRLEITGDRGRAVYEDGRISFLRNEVETSVFLRTSRSGFSTPPVWKCEIPCDPAPPSQHQIILDNVARVVSGREKVLMAPLEEGIRGLELGNAMMLSGWLGETVSLPMDSALYAEKLAERVKTSRYRARKTVRLEGDDFNSSF